jgi:hypothetical protein
MTGKLKSKPDDAHRKHLTIRAKDHIALVNKIVPDHLLKTPSQKRSESAKKRERKRAGKYEDSCRAAAADLLFDCYTCPKSPCGTPPEQCDEQMLLERCNKCGQPVRHFIDVDFKWIYCQVCRDVK